MNEKQTIVDKLKPFFAQFQELQQQAFLVYTPNVESIINDKVTDDNTIQRLLDGMLDFCGHNNMLLLYKKLCRYYWEINPEATAIYINFYREMWDNE